MGYRDYSVAKGHIVDASGHGDFTTITAASSAAVSGQTIFIRPGTYTENISAKPGVNYVAFVSDSDSTNVKIIGKWSLSTPGTVFFSGLNFQTNADFIFEVTGVASSSMLAEDCTFSVTDHTAFSFTSSGGGSITIFESQGDITTPGIALFSTSDGSINFVFCTFGNSGLSTTASTTSAGSFNSDYSLFSSPVAISGTGSTSLRSVTIDCNLINSTCLTLTSNQESFTRSCLFQSGSAIAVIIDAPADLVMTGTEINSANVTQISGTGQLRYADVQFSAAGASGTITTVTQVAFPWKPFGTSGNSTTAVRGTAGFDSTQFTVTDGFVQLSGGAGTMWTDTSGSFTASVNNGYFLTAASTPTLPAAPSQGDIVMFVCDTGSTVTVTANAGQRIRIGSALSAVAGTAASSTQGNALKLVYRSAATTWFSIPAPEGTWTVT